MDQCGYFQAGLFLKSNFSEGKQQTAKQPVGVKNVGVVKEKSSSEGEN